MEEKERYEIIVNKKNFIEIQDTESNADTFITEDNIEDLLNQQAEQIKDLKEKHNYLFEEFRDTCKRFEVMAFNHEHSKEEIKRLTEENQQLKQQLHDLPKKIVCEISEAIERLSWRKRIYTNWEFDKEQLYKDLDTILKKYGGEENGKSDM